MSNKKEELSQIVGKGNVLDDLETLKTFSRDQSFALSIRPSHPVSSGPPRFHGDTVPSAAGAVIVDLSGWRNRNPVLLGELSNV